MSNFNTGKVKKMGGMFAYNGCITSLDLSNFDTGNVEDMGYMFYDCDAMTSLDLSSFDTGNVTDMRFMFYMINTNNNLRTVYVGKYWNTDKVSDSEKMFNNCANLKGGNGTTFDNSKIDKTYAVIDKQGQAGYLTGLYTLTLPDNMEIVTDANNKVSGKYLNGSVVTIKAKDGYTASNVQANGTALTADENGVYTVTVDDDVTVSATYTLTIVTPQLDSDGFYSIGTVPELYGFAELVNNGNATANAKLTADIVVNENVLDANGDANTGDFEQWTPIGNDRYNDKVYSGTFDGQGHTISGLYVSGSGWNVGLIGTADGSVVVKNLGVVDFYFGSSKETLNKAPYTEQKTT